MFLRKKFIADQYFCFYGFSPIVTFKSFKVEIVAKTYDYLADRLAMYLILNTFRGK